MRFLMRNCLKYVHCGNAKMEFFRKPVLQQRYQSTVMLISPRLYVHIGSMGNPLIPDAEKHAFRPFYSLNLKNRYVNANTCINL